MKSYRKIADNVFARRDAYIIEQRRKKQVIARTTVSVGSVALVSLVGVGLFKNDVFRAVLPISDGSSTTTTVTVTTVPADAPSTTTSADATHDTTGEQTIDSTHPTATQTQPTATQTQPTQTTGTTVTTHTTVTTRLTQTTVTTGTKPTTQTTQTTPTTQPTTTDPSGDDPGEPLPPGPCLWIYYETRKNYGNEEIPIYFKLEGFEEVDLNWVQKTWYMAEGFSVVGDITVERDVETGGLIYRMVLDYDGVTPRPSFFFNVASVDGEKQTAGLYGHLADHGFFVSVSYDSAVSYSYYYLVETGVLTLDEYQAIMEKIWSGSMGWS